MLRSLADQAVPQVGYDGGYPLRARTVGGADTLLRRRPLGNRSSRDVARWCRSGLSVSGPFGCRCLIILTVPRFHIPLIKPDMQISRIKCVRAHLMRYVVFPLMWRQAGKTLIWLRTELALRHIRDCLEGAQKRH